MIAAAAQASAPMDVLVETAAIAVLLSRTVGSPSGGPNRIRIARKVAGALPAR